MARDPGSLWKPLPEAGAPDGHIKTQFIYHSTGTMASAAANWNFFNRGDVVVESTFIVGWGPEDPTLQIMDSTDHADANGSANRRGISVEVVGDGVGPYNDWQIRECIRLGRWARETHGISLRIIPSESEGGYGWHVMFGAPGPWTSVRGKVCPGGRRIQQLKDTIYPAIFTGSPMEEDDMPSLDDIFNHPIPRQGGLKGNTTLAATLAHLDANLSRIPDSVLHRPVPRAGGREGDTSLAGTIAWLDANLNALGAKVVEAAQHGDPEALAKALKDALGDELAGDVAARLRVTSV